MSLAVALIVLGLAVVVGGLSAFTGERGRRAVPLLRSFAVVAAAAIALVHLLPEAIAGAGYATVLAAAAGALVPALLERLVHPHEDHAHHVPAASLAMGYAAVVVHQAGEGAALASLARTGALSAGIVAAIAAHTVPLAMVVALRVLEVQRRRGGSGQKRATGLALAGVAGSTAAGAAAGSLVEASRLAAIQPWVLAGAAGLLLHALAHDTFEDAEGPPGARVRGAVGAVLGIAIAFLGVEPDTWEGGTATWLRVGGLALVVCGVVVRLVWPRPHRHGHGHG